MDEDPMFQQLIDLGILVLPNVRIYKIPEAMEETLRNKLIVLKYPEIKRILSVGQATAVINYNFNTRQVVNQLNLPQGTYLIFGFQNKGNFPRYIDTTLRMADVGEVAPHTLIFQRGREIVDVIHAGVNIPEAYQNNLIQKGFKFGPRLVAVYSGGVFELRDDMGTETIMIDP